MRSTAVGNNGKRNIMVRFARRTTTTPILALYARILTHGLMVRFACKTTTTPISALSAKWSHYAQYCCRQQWKTEYYGEVCAQNHNHAYIGTICKNIDSPSDGAVCVQNHNHAYIGTVGKMVTLCAVLLSATMENGILW